MASATESQAFGLKLGMDSALGWMDKGESEGEGIRSGDEDETKSEGVDSQSHSHSHSQLQFQLQGCGGGDWDRDRDGFERLRLGVSLVVSSGVIWRLGFGLQGRFQLRHLSMGMVRYSKSWTWVCLAGIRLGRIGGGGRLCRV